MVANSAPPVISGSAGGGLGSDYCDYRMGLLERDAAVLVVGESTDDTAMALALAESILERGLLDLNDLARRYAAWAASGPKDIGVTTAGALRGVAPTLSSCRWCRSPTFPTSTLVLPACLDVLRRMHVPTR